VHRKRSIKKLRSTDVVHVSRSSTSTLDAKTDLLTGLLAGIQTWKCVVRKMTGCTHEVFPRPRMEHPVAPLTLFRRNPHESKENIHLRPTSIWLTFFTFFSFRGTSVSLSKSRDTGTAQKRELAPPIQQATFLVMTIVAVAPIDAVLYHLAYIGPVLVIPPRLFRGRDHLFTILPQNFHTYSPFYHSLFTMCGTLSITGTVKSSR
jgi:hypothetical protein